jgi:hypothetical protein
VANRENNAKIEYNLSKKMYIYVFLCVFGYGWICGRLDFGSKMGVGVKKKSKNGKKTQKMTKKRRKNEQKAEKLNKKRKNDPFYCVNL